MNVRNVRKEAIKMTALYMAKCIAIQAVFIALVLVLSKGGIIRVEVDAISLVVAMAFLDIPLMFIAYSDFKKEVIRWEEKQEDEQNK